MLRRFAREVTGFELREGTVDVVGIEEHQLAREIVVIDFGEHQDLESDWTIGVIRVAQELPTQTEPRSPDGDMLDLHTPAPGKIEQPLRNSATH